MYSSKVIDCLIFLLPILDLRCPLDKLSDLLRTLLRTQWLKLVVVAQGHCLDWLFFWKPKLILVHIINLSLIEQPVMCYSRFYF
jgi:hypothetical protein